MCCQDTALTMVQIGTGEYLYRLKCSIVVRNKLPILMFLIRTENDNCLRYPCGTVTVNLILPYIVFRYRDDRDRK